MRFQVPQFIDIEDRIVGPLTLKQFLIYVVAAMLLVPVYVYSDLSLFITIAVPVIAAAAGFAHLKVNGLSLFQIMAYGAAFYTQNQMYAWRRTPQQNAINIQDSEWDSLIAGNISDYNEVSLLEAKARALETEGRVIQEDAEDPLDSESQTKT